MEYRLKDLRVDRDLSQQDVAKVLNMTRQNYARIENETVVLTFKDAITLANFYEIALEELISPDKRNNDFFLRISKNEMNILSRCGFILRDFTKRISIK